MTVSVHLYYMVLLWAKHIFIQADTEVLGNHSINGVGLCGNT